MPRVPGADSFSMLISTRQQISLACPDPELISIEDIASALSKICRYGAQGRWYSVAAHSVATARVARHFKLEGLPLAALMHDAAEAYLGDSIGPLRRFLRNRCACQPLGALDSLHRSWNRMLELKYGLIDLGSDTIRLLDDVAFAAEAPLVFGGEASFWREKGLFPVDVELSAVYAAMAGEVGEAMALEADGGPAGRAIISMHFLRLFDELKAAGAVEEG
jgi:hypothetical protein